MVDLYDGDQLDEIEQHHIALLDEHGPDHLDLSALTSRQRRITQTIATDLHDRLGAAAIRFPSKHDGNQTARPAVGDSEASAGQRACRARRATAAHRCARWLRVVASWLWRWEGPRANRSAPAVVWIRVPG